MSTRIQHLPDELLPTGIYFTDAEGTPDRHLAAETVERRMVLAALWANPGIGVAGGFGSTTMIVKHRDGDAADLETIVEGGVAVVHGNLIGTVEARSHGGVTIVRDKKGK